MLEIAQKIYETAQRYSESAKILNSINLEQRKSSQIMAALSLELYFKCIYLIENGKEFKVNGNRSHDFKKLFEDLDEKTKDLIVSYYNILISTRDLSDIKAIEKKMVGKHIINTSFHSIIENWSNVFIKFRYSYEPANRYIDMFFFPEIEEALLSIINAKMILDINSTAHNES